MTDRTPFYKVSGAGNDFVALIEPSTTPTAQQIVRWCRRGISIGADGVLVLRRDGDRVRLDYHNADGGLADLCLNGTRCAARLAFELGWGDESCELITGAGSVRAARHGATEVAIDAPLPAGAARELLLEAAGASWRGFHTVVGVPHFVVPTADLEAVDVATVGSPLRHHPELSPDGANVHFVHYAADGFSIRSYERGVETETLACGTGVLSAAQVGIETGRAALPLDAATRGGFTLRVEGSGGDRRISAWTLIGDARIVASGVLTAEA